MREAHELLLELGVLAVGGPEALVEQLARLGLHAVLALQPDDLVLQRLGLLAHVDELRLRAMVGVLQPLQLREHCRRHGGRAPLLPGGVGLHETTQRPHAVASPSLRTPSSLAPPALLL